MHLLGRWFCFGQRPLAWASLSLSVGSNTCRLVSSCFMDKQRPARPGSPLQNPVAKRQRTLTAAAEMNAKEQTNGYESLVDSSDFEALRKDMEHADAQREIIIKRSRDIQKLAKQATYSAHRSEINKCSSQLEEAQRISEELLPLLDELPDLRHGSFSNAMEEYAEAKIFLGFLQHGRVIPSKELEIIKRDEYLGGVLDFTGELNRYAVAKATVRDIKEVKRCRDLVDELMGEFLKFDLRNGTIRKKYDSLKYTLKKMENTLYELSLAEAGFKPQHEKDLEEPAAQQQTDQTMEQ